MRTFGVEEELLLVDVDTGVPVALADLVTRPETGDESPAPPGSAASGPGSAPAVSTPGGAMTVGIGVRDTPAQAEYEPDDRPVHELQREMIETETRPCSSLDDLADQLVERRGVAAQAAHRIGAEIAALATSPVPIEPSVTLDERYERMAELYAMTAQEQLTCGCHVHVSIESEEEGVAVLDRIRPWLPTLLALTANSPFWQGRDTGYCSYRRQVWGRWPSSGPTELFGTPEAYHATVEAMLSTGTLIDEGMVYFDARLSRHFPTVEVRVADVCLRVHDAVLLASLVRALVDTAARDWRLGHPPVQARLETLNLAYWRASRSGLEDDLIHPVTGQAAPAEKVLRTLLRHIGDALDEAEAATGRPGLSADLLQALLARGNGAAQQRRIYQQSGDLPTVVRNAVAHTLTVE
ncbi:MAG TPA: glutamate--cysteine ligase [Streptosporangiaceae bacterium]|nr:glutamate--cysteine ligase [Streptosporangiaceae bacterium]